MLSICQWLVLQKRILLKVGTYSHQRSNKRVQLGRGILYGLAQEQKYCYQLHWVALQDSKWEVCDNVAWSASSSVSNCCSSMDIANTLVCKDFNKATRACSTWLFLLACSKFGVASARSLSNETCGSQPPFFVCELAWVNIFQCC